MSYSTTVEYCVSKVLYHRGRFKKNLFSNILKVKVISRPFHERNYIHGSILMENRSFSRNCDIKTTKCEERHGRFYLGKVWRGVKYLHLMPFFI